MTKRNQKTDRSFTVLIRLVKGDCQMKIQALIFITSILMLISFVHESEQFGGTFNIPPSNGKRQLNFKVCGIKGRSVHIWV